MLRCEDDSIYTGITVDIKRRMQEHFNKNEKCAKYTMNHNAKKLEAVWESENRISASKLEYYIKRLNKDQKEKLILKNNIVQLFDAKINTDAYIKIK